MRERRFLHGRRITPSTAGSVLKDLRLANGLEPENVAKFYGRGTLCARIREIEESGWVDKRVESAFRAAVDVAVVERERRKDFRNLKISGGKQP